MDEIDRILASEETLTPSSGFADAVMEAVRDAAAAPPPLPFPWGRFALGLVACTVATASGTTLVVQMDLSVFQPAASQLAAVAPELGYALAAAIASLAALRVRRVLAEP